MVPLSSRLRKFALGSYHEYRYCRARIPGDLLLVSHSSSPFRIKQLYSPVEICRSCFLLVIIVLAVFQNKWIGAISGLTGLLIVVNTSTLLFSGFLLATSFLPDSLQTKGDRIIRTLEQPRLGLVMNSVGLGLWFILSITQTASALSSAACKDPSSDPHAKSSKGNDDDFVKALPSFCSTKKAGAAFCWLIWCKWSV
jgi:hypothetical protein